MIQQENLSVRYKFWVAALEAEGIPKAQQPAHIVAFRHIIGYRIYGRPKWGDANNPEHLQTLTAPAFLRQIHADDIIENHLYKETIRLYDPDLMKAVESYISKRERRGRNLGDATGLVFVLSKPPTNRAPQRRSLPTFNKFQGPDGIV